MFSHSRSKKIWNSYHNAKAGQRKPLVAFLCPADHFTVLFRFDVFGHKDSARPLASVRQILICKAISRSGEFQSDSSRPEPSASPSASFRPHGNIPSGSQP